MKKVLVIKTSALGDVIQTFSAVAKIKEQYPDCRIDWVSERFVAKLLNSLPILKKVLVIDTKKWKKSFNFYNSFKEFLSFIKDLRKEEYDAVFDLQGNCKSGIITFFTKSKHKIGFDFKSAAEWPNALFTHHHVKIPIEINAYETYEKLIQSALSKKALSSPLIKLALTDEDKIRLQEFYKLRQEMQKCIVIGFGSNWENKKLDPKLLNAFLKKIDQSFTFVIPYLSLDQNEVDMIKEGIASLCFKDLSFAACQELIRLSDAYIGVDSALLHLAMTTETPVFAIFGPSLGSYYLRKGEKCHEFQGKCPYGKIFKKRCPLLRSCFQAPCTKQLSIEELSCKFQSFWQSVHHFD